jgi:hypothetical protein
MAQLDATPSGVDSNAYATLDEVSSLLDGYPPKVQDAWDNYENEEGDPESAPSREWMLLRATTLIDEFTGWGAPKVKGQALAFPRFTDAAGVVPKEVKAAVAAYVAFVLDEDLTPIKKLQEEGVTSANILGQSVGLAEERSGLPAGARRILTRLRRRAWSSQPVNRDEPASERLVGQDDDGMFFGGG